MYLKKYLKSYLNVLWHKPVKWTDEVKQAGSQKSRTLDTKTESQIFL